jgi:hypothetical protein
VDIHIHSDADDLSGGVHICNGGALPSSRNGTYGIAVAVEYVHIPFLGQLRTKLAQSSSLFLAPMLLVCCRKQTAVVDLRGPSVIAAVCLFTGWQRCSLVH